MKTNTKLTRIGRTLLRDGPVAINPDIVRASTILFPNMDSYDAAGKD
jgi:cystathionine beta-lyase